MSGGLVGALGHQRAGRGVGVSGVHWGCQGVWGLRGQQRCRGISGPVGGVGGIGVAGGLGAQPHWAPVQGPSTPTGFPWGVTYLAKAKQVTEMSSAGYYIHLALYLVTVCTFVSTLPNHIFLHAM